MIDGSEVRQRITQFHQRNGGECYELDGWLWYPTGAHREAGEPLGALVEPPKHHSTSYNEYQSLAFKLRFHIAKLNHAVRQFDDLQEKLTFQRPNDEKAAIKQLEDLQAIVEARKEEVKQAQELVDATSIGQRRKTAQNRPQLETAQRNEWREKLKKVRI